MSGAVFFLNIFVTSIYKKRPFFEQFMSEKIVHSFEAGRRGKPDELDSGLAHLIGAYFLEQNKDARFDLRVSGGSSADQLEVRISGEVSGSLFTIPTLQNEVKGIVIDYYNRVHKTRLTESDFHIVFRWKPQAETLAANGKAGDSGNPIAVAYRESPLYLPWERVLAVGLRNELDSIFQDDGNTSRAIFHRTKLAELKGLNADGKVSVDALYEGTSFKGLQAITVAAQHEPNILLDDLRRKIHRVIDAYLAEFAEQHDMHLGDPTIVINGLGPWHHGGWRVDEGCREAKSYRDGFGSYGVMEDSFSGEDPSKPSATGTFLARYIAVQVVGNHLADFARLGLRYTIGQEEVGLNITTQDTGKKSQERIESWVRSRIPKLDIGSAIRRFNLTDANLYKKIVQCSDFFHHPEFPWNRFEMKY